MVHERGQADVRVRAGPAGIHLFNRKTGLNVLFDDLCVPRYQWASAPRQIAIAVTNACDLECRYCYAPKHRAHLEPELVIRWLVELDSGGCLGVGFGGGEPTLYRHLPDVCHYAAKYTRLAVTFTTHAHQINEALAERLQGSVHFLRVSMDGVGPTYESLRGRSFEDLRRHIEVVRLLAPFGINFVVNARTFPDLDRATELAAELGAREFLLLPERPVRELGGIDPLTLRALRTWVRSYRGTIPLTITEADAAGFPVSPTVANETGLRAYASIDAGAVIRQSSYATDGVPIGPEGVMAALQLLRIRSKEVLS